MSYRYNLIAEKLISTVAKAFYTDDLVIIVETLLREKFIAEDELGPRLRLSQNYARELILKLVDGEMIVKIEEIVGQKGQKLKYYYIDYQSVVNIIRLRIYEMQKSVESQETKHSNEDSFICPTCQKIYDTHIALRYLSKDYKRICPACCPEINYSAVIANPKFQLQKMDKSNSLNEIEKLAIKMNEQLTSSSDHDGIVELLGQLRDQPLNRNKPSDNVRLGKRSTQIQSTDIQTEIIELNANKKSNKVEFDLKEHHFNLLSTKADSSVLKPIEETVPTEVVKVEKDLKDENEDEQPLKRLRESNAPEFLLYSGVKGASDIINELKSLQQQRGIFDTQTQSQTTITTNLEQHQTSTVIISTTSKLSNDNWNQIKLETETDIIIEKEDEDIQWDDDEEED